jgi:hypothetical protein
MSFIGLEFMGIQSPDIMADCTEAKQVLLARHRASNRQMTLRNAGGNCVFESSFPLSLRAYMRKMLSFGSSGKSMREAVMIRSGKLAIFPGVEQLFLVRKAIASGTLNPEYRRFVSSGCHLFLRAMRAGRLSRQSWDDSFCKNRYFFWSPTALSHT